MDKNTQNTLCYTLAAGILVAAGVAFLTTPACHTGYFFMPQIDRADTVWPGCLFRGSLPPQPGVTKGYAPADEVRTVGQFAAGIYLSGK